MKTNETSIHHCHWCGAPTRSPLPRIEDARRRICTDPNCPTR